MVVGDGVSVLLFITTFTTTYAGRVRRFTGSSFRGIPRGTSLAQSYLDSAVSLKRLISLRRARRLGRLGTHCRGVCSGGQGMRTLSTAMSSFFSSGVCTVQRLPMAVGIHAITDNSAASGSCLFYSKTKGRIALKGSSASLKDQFCLGVLPTASNVPCLVCSDTSGAPLSINCCAGTPSSGVLVATGSGSKSLCDTN